MGSKHVIIGAPLVMGHLHLQRPGLTERMARVLTLLQRGALVHRLLVPSQGPSPPLMTASSPLLLLRRWLQPNT